MRVTHALIERLASDGCRREGGEGKGADGEELHFACGFGGGLLLNMFELEVVVQCCRFAVLGAAWKRMLVIQIPAKQRSLPSSFIYFLHLYNQMTLLFLLCSVRRHGKVMIGYLITPIIPHLSQRSGIIIDSSPRV